MQNSTIFPALPQKNYGRPLRHFVWAALCRRSGPVGQMGGSRFMLPAGGFIGVPVLFPARVWGSSWELWLCRLAAWVRCRIRLCPLARTLHERAPLFHAKCPSRSGNVPAPSCTPPHPFAEAPPAPPETGAMPPPDMTNVSLRMFPLNMTNVYPRHDSCFRPALSAPPAPAPGRPCGLPRNFRAPSAPSAGARPLHGDGAWKVLSRRPCGGGPRSLV